MLDCIQKILDKKVLELIPDGGKSVQLKDCDSDMTVEITEIAELRIVIKVDKHLGHLPGLNKNKQEGVNKICDYLLFVPANGNYHAVFIELKRTYSKHANEQLRCSRPILDYLLSACSLHCDLKPKVSVKYVTIVEKLQKNIDKQPVKRTPGKAVSCKDYKQIKVGVFLAPSVTLDALLTC